jgi:hypothetical protein
MCITLKSYVGLSTNYIESNLPFRWYRLWSGRGSNIVWWMANPGQGRRFSLTPITVWQFNRTMTSRITWIRMPLTATQLWMTNADLWLFIYYFGSWMTSSITTLVGTRSLFRSIVFWSLILYSQTCIHCNGENINRSQSYTIISLIGLYGSNVPWINTCYGINLTFGDLDIIATHHMNSVVTVTLFY